MASVYKATDLQTIAGAKAISKSKGRLLLPALLCLLYLAQCAWFISTQSLTFDEPLHIISGLEAWRYGRFERWRDHPPLARLLFTLPLMRGDWEVEVRGPIRPSPEAISWRVRPVNVLFGLLLAGLLWAAARRLFSEGAANLALALFAFSPTLIANFSVATTDGIGALMIFAAAVQLVRWRRNPSRLQTAILGLVLGGLLVAKFYTPPLFVLAVGLVLVLKPEAVVLRPKGWNWGKAAAVVAIAFAIVWGAYSFHVSKVTLRDGFLAVAHPGISQLAIKHMPTPFDLTLSIPAGEYLAGLASIWRKHRWGGDSFFLGEVSTRGGWKLYYPAVILLKWPTIVLLLFLIAATLALFRRLRIPRDLLLMMLFPTVLLSLAISSKISTGDRHILPVYPFILLFSAGLWQLARRRRAVLVLVIAAAFVQAADCLRYAPDYLSYFNVFVKPEESYKLLTDCNLDWGQGLIALRKYEAEHPNEKIYLAYFGSVDPAQYGIRALPLRPNEWVSGTVVVSATHLSGQHLRNPYSYRWVLQFPRKTILNHTLHVFDVSADATLR